MTETNSGAATGPEPLSNWQCWLAGSVGVLASAAGIAAVFLKNNNGGAAVLLVIGLVFLLMATTRRAITSVKIPGGGQVDLEALRLANEAKTNADEAKGAAESATQQAGYAVAKTETSSPRLDLRSALLDEEIVRDPSATSGFERARPEEGLLSSQMTELANQYDEIRSEFKSGPGRTQRMTAIVAEMGYVSQHIADFNWRDALHSNRPGARLSGYIYLLNRPTEDGASELADALLRGDNPFGEYWALLSLQKCLAIANPAIVTDVTNRIQQLDYPPGTDRSYELTQTRNLTRALRQVEP